MNANLRSTATFSSRCWWSLSSFRSILPAGLRSAADAVSRSGRGLPRFDRAAGASAAVAVAEPARQERRACLRTPSAARRIRGTLSMRTLLQQKPGPLVTLILEGGSDAHSGFGDFYNRGGFDGNAGSAQTYDPKYPVCLQVYQGFVDYYFECAYTSMAQCRMSASGRAASCVVNPYYAGESPARPSAAPRLLRARELRSKAREPRGRRRMCFSGGSACAGNVN